MLYTHRIISTAVQYYKIVEALLSLLIYSELETCSCFNRKLISYATVDSISSRCICERTTHIQNACFSL